MADRRTGPTLIQSVQRALRLLEAVSEHEGRAHAKELSRAAGLPLATTYHLLRTLSHEGYLQHLDDGTYALGHRIDVLRSQGSAARSVANARPALEWLRDELGSAVYLARHVDGEIVIVEIVDSPKAPRIDLWVGVHDAAHATALGKCILGQLPAAGPRRLPRAAPAARPHAAHGGRPRPAARPAARCGLRCRRRRGVRRGGVLPRRARRDGGRGRVAGVRHPPGRPARAVPVRPHAQHGSGQGVAGPRTGMRSAEGDLTRRRTI